MVHAKRLVPGREVKLAKALAKFHACRAFQRGSLFMTIIIDMIKGEHMHIVYKTPIPRTTELDIGAIMSQNLNFQIIPSLLFQPIYVVLVR